MPLLHLRYSIYRHLGEGEIVSKTFCNSLDKSQNVGRTDGEKRSLTELMMFENQLTLKGFSNNFPEHLDSQDF